VESSGGVYIKWHYQSRYARKKKKGQYKKYVSNPKCQELGGKFSGWKKKRSTIRAAPVILDSKQRI